MNNITWDLQRVLKENYANFSGRASRSEYWYFLLVNILVTFIITLLFGESGIISKIYTLIIFIPSLAVSIRRLHDIDKSGWWVCLGFVPLLNLILLYWACKESTVGENRFGEEPLR